MKDIYSDVKNLAKSTKSQNFFVAVKEVNGLRLFKNVFDLSKIQLMYLSYLYMYDSINRDIIVDKISKHVLESDILEESYLLWKRSNNKKLESKDNKKSEISLIVSNKINFPKEVK